jgi:hypothetical protein
MLVFKNYHGAETLISFDEAPDRCPVCNNGIKPLFRYASNHNQNIFLEIVWQCPVENCQKLFIATYNQKRFVGGYEIGRFSPQKILTRVFDKEISGISPNFILIYNQAEIAEKNNLMQICGPGYRKALEFLIKDYLINYKPEAKEAIEQSLLMPCISKYVDNTNIKECAKRAVWIGNDETHYKRKWEDKDIGDLKSIIELTLYWIASEIKTQQLLADMAKGK